MAFEFEDVIPSLRNAGTSRTSDIMHNVDRIYQHMVDRNADPGGRDYWVDKIQSGQNSYRTLFDTLAGTDEHIDQRNYLSANPNATSEDLDALPSAYVSPFDAGSGSVWAGWTPGDPITLEMARSAATTQSNPDGSQVVDDDGNYITKASYDDQTNFTQSDITGTGNGSSTITNNESNPLLTNNGQYLTAADLTAWWNSLDKPWLNQTQTQTNNNDDFMRLMMFMALMRPQGGGGYGGGSYGYGGLNPGGVQSAYNPMANLQGYMDAFNTLPGISTNTINTGTT